jgi:arginase
LIKYLNLLEVIRGGYVMNFNVIGVPINLGCDRDGAQLGPDVLRGLGIMKMMKKEGHFTYDKGNIKIPKVSDEEKYLADSKLKYLTPIVDINTSLAKKVYNTLDSGCFPFVLGGDHSLGIGSIAGASRYFNEIAVIWIDAHGDINTGDTSPSGNIHGMPLAASMNVGHPTLTNIYFKGQKVKPENVYILGGRDIDPGEYDLAKELKLNLYTMDIIEEKGLEEVLNLIINKIKSSNVDGVHLSFDIDALDKSIVPGTGTAVDNGLNLEEGKFLFTKLIGEGFVTSMDFVELNPTIDDVEKTTIKTCTELLRHIFKCFKYSNYLEIAQ